LGFRNRCSPDIIKAICGPLALRLATKEKLKVSCVFTVIPNWVEAQRYGLPPHLCESSRDGTYKTFKTTSPQGGSVDEGDARRARVRSWRVAPGAGQAWLPAQDHPTEPMPARHGYRHCAGRQKPLPVAPRSCTLRLAAPAAMPLVPTGAPPSQRARRGVAVRATASDKGDCQATTLTWPPDSGGTPRPPLGWSVVAMVRTDTSSGCQVRRTNAWQQTTLPNSVVENYSSLPSVSVPMRYLMS